MMLLLVGFIFVQFLHSLAIIIFSPKKGVHLILKAVFAAFQILWLVGSNQVSPNMEAIRSDTPPQLRKLVKDCIQYERDKRPVFRHVLSVVEDLMRTLPKTHRSLSEPILNRLGITSDLLGTPATAGDAAAAAAVAATPQPSVLA